MRNPHKVGTEAWARREIAPYVSRFNKKPHDPGYCCSTVFSDGRSVYSHQCSRKPKVWYGSLGYCAQHDPAAVIARRNAADAKFLAELDARKAARDRAENARKLREAALDAIRQIAAGHNDPRSLAIDVLSHETTPPTTGEDS